MYNDIPTDIAIVLISMLLSVIVTWITPAIVLLTSDISRFVRNIPIPILYYNLYFRFCLILTAIIIIIGSSIVLWIGG